MQTATNPEKPHPRRCVGNVSFDWSRQNYSSYVKCFFKFMTVRSASVLVFFFILSPLSQEYMVYRKHTYMRLDGSSKISERRDMVADFQSRWVQTQCSVSALGLKGNQTLHLECILWSVALRQRLIMSQMLGEGCQVYIVSPEHYHQTSFCFTPPAAPRPPFFFFFPLSWWRFNAHSKMCLCE